MTDAQWETLKAVAPILAIGVSLLTILVSTITAFLVATYNAKHAFEASRRADLAASIQRYRNTISFLISFLRGFELPTDKTKAPQVATEMSQLLEEESAFINHAAFHLEMARLEGTQTSTKLEFLVAQLRQLKLHVRVIAIGTWATDLEYAAERERWAASMNESAATLERVKKNIEDLLFGQ